MQATSLTLRHVFERHRDRPWVFVRPGGNWGDQLIFAGAELLADRLGLQWQSCETSEFRSLVTAPEQCIYLHGSGGYNSWSSGRPFLDLESALEKDAHLVVQGPVSTEGNVEFLSSRLRSALTRIGQRNLIFFAREKITLAILHEVGLAVRGATVSLDHDTAFAVTARDLLAIAGLRTMPTGRYELVALREDHERPDPAKPGPGTTGKPPAGIVLDPVYTASSFAHWVRIHLHARSITTNRLHSAVAGAIAGKPVTLGPGSYHKNAAVWQYSLAARGVRWVDGIPASVPLWRMLPLRIQNSYKARLVRLALHGVPMR